MRVTVVFATATLQDVVAVELPASSTVGDAIARSGLLATHGLELAALATAVYGQRCSLDRRVDDGDRIELLRPLVADPKESRRHRAAARRAARTR